MVRDTSEYRCREPHITGQDDALINNWQPGDLYLTQNYPNPFNPLTRITFYLPVDNYVSLKVFDALGNEVSTIVADKLNRGDHTYTFDGRDLASGVYYYQLVAGDHRAVKKMLLLR